MHLGTPEVQVVAVSQVDAGEVTTTVSQGMQTLAVDQRVVRNIQVLQEHCSFQLIHLWKYHL